MRILVSGGGTGGHVSPVLATVDALRRRDNQLEVLYVGRRGGVEADLARSAGLRFVGIEGGKFRRLPNASVARNLLQWRETLWNLRDACLIVVGLAESLGIMLRFRPDVVFNKGGPTGIPIGLAAHLLQVPMVIHEPDVIPGWGNRVLSRWASKIAVGFPKALYREFPSEKTEQTGTPVQPVMTTGERADGRRQFGFDLKKPLMLIVGGSQGAVALNSAVIEVLPDLLRMAQVHHLTGGRDHERVTKRVEGQGISTYGVSDGYRADASLAAEAMAAAYAAADVVVARAGANTIAELAALAKPAILVPNRAAAAHQLRNAEVVGEAGGALVIDESGAALRAAASRAFSNPERKRLASGIKQFAHPDAADRLADLLISTARDGGRKRR